MRGSKKGPPPPLLEQWRRENPDVRTWKSLDGGAKRQLLQTLQHEQDGLCVYCGRTVDVDRRDSRGNALYHVEHFRPRSHYRELIFDHSNLYLSCGHHYEENDPPPVRAICGVAKGEWFDDELHINPNMEICAISFSFNDAGLVEAVNNDPAALIMIEVLNLNEAELTQSRRTIWSEVVQQQVEAANSGDIELLREVLMDTFGAISPFGRRQAYSHFVMYMLTGKAS